MTGAIFFVCLALERKASTFQITSLRFKSLFKRQYTTDTPEECLTGFFRARKNPCYIWIELAFFQ